jgi:3'-phosphoadenosine 5'-phosphosulfate sulfotransferase (PAPS reductase)/FAD synthetase
MTKLSVPTSIRSALDRGAVVALSVSGGKDSQAMAGAVLDYMRSEGLTNNVIAVHADLGRAEWWQTPVLVEKQAAAWGIPLHVVTRADGADLLEHMDNRGRKLEGSGTPFWPSSKNRYCTSDLKRDPIDKLLRTLGPLVISVEGIRAEESAGRKKKPCWEVRSRIDCASREALTWRPIHAWTEVDVWEALGGRHGPLVHPAYAEGNARLSCSICIFQSSGDMLRGALHNPEFFGALVEMEELYGATYTQKVSLVDMFNVLEDGATGHWKARVAAGRRMI